MKRVKVDSLEEYFKLLKRKRVAYGFWYLKPRTLSWDIYNPNNKMDGGWNEFSVRIRKEFPIQGFFREYLFDYDNPVYSFFMIKKRQLTDFIYSFKCFFNPSHKIVRKELTREWRDCSCLLLDVNLAIIKDFYQEAANSWVDWEADEFHSKFYVELKRANRYITVTRPKLFKKIDSGHEFASKNQGLSYEQQYGKVNYFQNLLDKFDTKIIVWAVENRRFFWT